MRSADAAIIALALCASLASCTQNQQAVEKPVAEAITETGTAPLTPAPSMDPPVAGSNLPESDAPSAAEARQVVVDYYAAINAHDYRKAYGLWSEDGAASGQSFEHFSGGYANTESVDATVGEAVDEEGAAGSRYINVPVELHSKLYNGTMRTYKGRFTLRAVVADGATETQRRWHLASAEMQRVP